MILGAWLIVCVVLNVALRRRLATLLGLTLAIWVVVPGAAGDALTGVHSLHGATVLIVLSWLVQMVNPSGLAVRELTSRPVLYACLGAFLFLASAESVVQGISGLSGLLNMVVAPILLFHLIRIAMRQDPRARSRFTTWFVALASGEALLGVIQSALQQNLFWVSNFESAYSWYTDTYVRSQGTLDQPIILGAFCVTAIPLLAGYRRLLVVLPLTCLLVMGIASAGARSALIFIVPAVLVVIFRSRFTTPRRAALVVALGAGVVLLVNSPLAQPIVSHLNDPGDSTDLRAQAYTWFFHHWTSFLLTPGGYGSSYTVSNTAGLGSSFESAPIMFYLDFGVLAVLLYFGVQGYLVVNGLLTAGAARGTTIAALAAVYIPFTYSSYSWTNVSAVVTWSVLALAFESKDRLIPAAAPASPADELARDTSPVLSGTATMDRHALKRA